MKKLLVVFGTRPEAIKMAPLVKCIADSNEFTLEVCVTAQHREMLDQVLELFEINPCYDLDIMKPGQSLSEVTSRILNATKDVLNHFEPDLVLVHGDTTTTLATALSAYYEKIDVAHVEAGLRTNDIYSPHPEELNRKLTAAISKFNFCPTIAARDNLLSEGISAAKCFVTGNTVIDALHTVEGIISHKPEKMAAIADDLKLVDITKKIILVTAHRRENFGSGLQQICDAILQLSKSCPTVEIVFPVHLNPNVRNVVFETLGNLENVKLLPPLEYFTFTYLLKHVYIVLTDSGGLQEEAPFFRIPVLVMRDKTERHEAVSAGTVKLVGTRTERIVREVTTLLVDKDKYRTMASAVNPYGDGTASKQILKILENTYAN